MKKVIFGTGFLICGTLSVLTFALITAIHFMIFDLADLRMFITPVAFDNIGYFFLAVGVGLSIWGLVEKDKRDTKKVIVGTGVLMCGMLGVFTSEIIRATRIASLLGWGRPFSFWHTGWVLFIVGIALSIWGLAENRKRTPRKTLDESLKNEPSED